MTDYIEFSDEARSTLLQARVEAAALHHELVGTEHVLLGILKSRDARLSAGFDRMGGDALKLRRSVLSLLGVDPGTDPSIQADLAVAVPELPFTRRSKVLIEHSMREALEFGTGRVTPAELFLGALREGNGVAAAALAECGVTVEAARAALQETPPPN